MFRLTKSHLKELVATNTLLDFNAVIRSGSYGREFDVEADLNPDIVCERELGRLYASLRRRYTHSPVPIIAYMYFKEREIKSLTTLIESVRYRLAPETIMKLIYGGEPS
jgi:V/A-type H+-transporting ATPase subunit C